MRLVCNWGGCCVWCFWLIILLRMFLGMSCVGCLIGVRLLMFLSVLFILVGLVWCRLNVLMKCRLWLMCWVWWLILWWCGIFYRCRWFWIVGWIVVRLFYWNWLGRLCLLGWRVLICGVCFVFWLIVMLIKFCFCG